MSRLSVSYRLLSSTGCVEPFHSFPGGPPRWYTDGKDGCLMILFGQSKSLLEMHIVDFKKQVRQTTGSTT
ncbi:hypothetical protein PISMIDRAFT_672399 [Pisolithus microcarpus 441]|uniref:Uncharacterized protein n=1 Tax=Pisolithus microcarpus 441 TaxID=765257 RepID=A0A0C9ZSQ5_9AGAM|nr:hypothetical protein PISMIDRAFT_672399 [Pisolithus microcarpus 441]